FAQIFQLKDGVWVHECQSMASAGLSMRLGKGPRGDPQEGAAEFPRLPDAPRAAQGALPRLVQMKAPGRPFSAVDGFQGSPSDRERSRYQLRLLSTPAYRYQDTEQGVNDGAVFAFVHGTDPELFLILENRGDGEKAGWYYSLVPMTCWGVTAQLSGTEVW